MKDPQNDITSEDEIKIGKTIDDAFLAYIDTCPDIDYLGEDNHSQAYHYLNQFSLKIRASNQFTTSLPADQTSAVNNPTLRILDKAGNTGAFVSPGGYIYIYKDLLNIIDYEAQFVPILAHLLTCSQKRYDVQKLKAQFSPSFLLDLALGGTINNSYGTDIHSILATLEETPYSTDIVELLDDQAENTACELGYDIQTYSNLFTQSNTKNLQWYRLFPRSTSIGDYAAHLFNNVTDSLSCNGTITEGDYLQFKSALN